MKTVRIKRPSTPLTRKRVRRAGGTYRVELRREVIAAYGGRCTCPPCGEAQFEFLTLEHLRGDGAAHRAAVGRNAQAQLLDIKKRGFPAEYTILCYNCNLAKAIYGTCPHLNVEWSERDTGRTHFVGDDCPGAHA